MVFIFIPVREIRDRSKKYIPFPYLVNSMNQNHNRNYFSRKIIMYLYYFALRDVSRHYYGNRYFISQEINSINSDKFLTKLLFLIKYYVNGKNR